MLYPMDPNSGQLIPASERSKLSAEEQARFSVLLEGPPAQIERISRAVKAQRRARAKRSKASRRRNR